MKLTTGLLFFLLVLGFFSCKNEDKQSLTDPAVDQNYNIEINIAGLGNSIAYLTYYAGSPIQLVMVDSVKGQVQTNDSSNSFYSAFNFNADSSLKRGLYKFSVPSHNLFMDLIINNDQNFSLKSDTLELINNMEVTGSEENSFFYKNLKEVQKIIPRIVDVQQAFIKAQGNDEEIARLNDELTEISEELQARQGELMSENEELFAVKLMKAGQAPRVPEDLKEQAKKSGDQLLEWNYMRNKYWEQVDFADARLIRTNFMEKKLDTYLDQLTPQKSDSLIQEIDKLVLESKKNQEVFRFVLEHIFNKYTQRRNFGFEQVYVHILDKYYVSGEAFWAQQPDA
ncbi:MAG: DUF5106 domain-containing protein [Bacteroidia bacterium]|nr:DUF5106 domain-containing protein [Bacteroidia bacterium]